MHFLRVAVGSSVKAGARFILAGRSFVNAAPSSIPAGRRFVNAGRRYVKAGARFVNAAPSFVKEVGSFVNAGGNFVVEVGHYEKIPLCWEWDFCCVNYLTALNSIPLICLNCGLDAPYKDFTYIFISLATVINPFVGL